MAKVLLPLCSSGKIAMRDGYTGATAHIILPFLESGSGFWFASGQQYSFPKSQVGQNLQRTVSGINRPDTYQKDCCSCLSGT